ncbi:MAG: radical SAM protein, partial [Planctomycetia bacterium]|nr:radical SAM protein [Planctomycetia bacterium]
RRRSPDVVGIYATSFTLWEACLVARMAKSANRDTKVMMGGPHVSLYAEETLALDAIDYVVRGEGDFVTPELLDCIDGDREPAGVLGVGYTAGGKPVVNPEAEPVDLNKLPIPARELTQYDSYYSVLGSDKVATTIMSSRGCPYDCAFCYQPYGRRTRMRSADNLCDELEACMKLGIQEMFFFDENFTLNARRASEVCDEIISRGLQISFAVRSRVDTVSAELLRKLKDAGCHRIQFGVESGSPEILKAMKKRITLEQARQAFKAAHEVGLITYADFMLGYPGESMEQMDATIEFARELNPDFVQYGVTMYLPSTEIYEDALKDGLLEEDFWREHARNPSQHIGYPMALGEFDQATLEQIQRKAHTQFYFRPRYVLRRLSRVRSFREFTRQAKAAFGLIAGRFFS